MSSMQRDPIVSKASELIRLGLMPSKSEIKSGKVGEHPLLTEACTQICDRRIGGEAHSRIGGHVFEPRVTR